MGLFDNQYTKKDQRKLEEESGLKFNDTPKKSIEPVYASGIPTQKNSSSSSRKEWQGPIQEGQSSNSSSSSSSRSKKNTKKDYEDGGQKKALKKQKKAVEKARKKRKKSYNRLYDTLRGNLLAQRGDVQTQRDTALTGMEGDYQNAVDRLGRGREEMTQYYDDQEGDLRNSYADQRKERERIFQARNITNSSYYIDAVTEADTEFNKTLSRLGGDEARYLAEQDTQIKELGQNKMAKRSEIEMAYNQMMRQIENDLSKTDFERSNAMQQLEDEYTSKMSTISQQMLEIQQQQQAFRERAASMAADKSYASNDYGYDINNQALMKQGMTPQEAIQAGYLSAINGKKDDINNRFMSSDRTLPQGAQAGAFKNGRYYPSQDDINYLSKKTQTKNAPAPTTTGRVNVMR